jgi:regulator of sigma E protease
VTTIVAFLFVLGVLIFVHELGHFLAARRLGIKVLTFSLGFGPKIFKLQRGDTEYCISVVPLGGYVKMAGENPEDPRSGGPDEFLSRTKWERFQVLIMGPVMNLVLAVVVMAFVLAQGAEIPVFQDQPPIVGMVQPGSAAEKVGIMRGDRILAVDNDEVDTWDALYLQVGTRPNREIPVRFQRDGQILTVTVHTGARGEQEVGSIGVLPDSAPVVAALRPGEVPGDPAIKAGIQKNDAITAVNNERIVFASQFTDAVKRAGAREVDLTIRRNGQDRHVRVTPTKIDDTYMIGISIADATKTFQPTPLEAVKLSFVRNWEASGLIFRTLGGLFTGTTSVRQLQGPVGIAQLSGEAARTDFLAVLSLMAVLSLNLGLINLMPVPVLDGGHITIMALEGIARRDFSMQAKEKMLLAGFVVLMMLMVTVIYNDLTRISWLERLMPWRN